MRNNVKHSKYLCIDFIKFIGLSHMKIIYFDFGLPHSYDKNSNKIQKNYLKIKTTFKPFLNLNFFLLYLMLPINNRLVLFFCMCKIIHVFVVNVLFLLLYLYSSFQRLDTVRTMRNC